MWSVSDTIQETRRKADIACCSCRKRKVKCDRTLPQCSVCENARQRCSYPEGPLKPGPKIGSTQRLRKRRRTNDDGCDADSASASFQESSSPATSRCPGSATQSREAPSSEHDSGERRPSQVRMHDIWMSLHPSHAAPQRHKSANSDCGEAHAVDQGPNLMATVCSSLELNEAQLAEMLHCYFDHMVAISLFHEPTFSDKLSRITSRSQLCALLATLLSFASRFLRVNDADGTIEPVDDAAPNREQQTKFLAIALKSIDEALDECDDEPPSLAIIQALIVVTFCQLTTGVRGRAWRSLGTCIRVAYEMNLHLVDAGHAEAVAGADECEWRQREEERRAWWAIWEMDVFASTVRRMPSAMDWSQMETMLPIDEQDWFDNKPVSSCFMERDPINRWKALSNHSHLSPKAWFLVINSLMKEAQLISSPNSVSCQLPDADRDRETFRSTSLLRATESTHDAARKLDLLANCILCLELALPAYLRYSNQRLTFDARQPGQTRSLRQLHCDIYNIHLMTQLAKLMSYRPAVLAAGNPAKQPSKNLLNSPPLDSTQQARGDSNPLQPDAANLELSRYFGATDEILSIIHHSDKNHIRYINPFLASTIWLASAVQLLRRKLAQDEFSQALARSKFEVLNMTYQKCASFWDIQTSLQRNLESLEAQLVAFYSGSVSVERRRAREIDAGRECTQQTPRVNCPGASHSPQSSRNTHRERRGSARDALSDSYGDNSVQQPDRRRLSGASSLRRLECGSEKQVTQLPSPPHVSQAASNNAGHTILQQHRIDDDMDTVATGFSGREVGRLHDSQPMTDYAPLVNGTQIEPCVEPPPQQPLDVLSEFDTMDQYQGSNYSISRGAVCNPNIFTDSSIHNPRDTPVSLLSLGQFFGGADLGAMFLPSNGPDLFSEFFAQ